MRLICPNCGAQYEVDDGMIPDDGRDVQCSNCGHTWFESPDAPSAAAEDSGTAPAMKAPAPAATHEPEDVPEVQAQAAPEPEPDVDSEPESEPENVPEAKDTQETVADAEPQPAPQPPTTPTPRPALDSSIAEILREEAAREEAARRAETDDGLQSQGDLGLTDPGPAVGSAAMAATRSGRADADAGQQRLERLRGSPVGAAPVAAARSEMFPDIEEINSSLRSSAERGPMAMLPAEVEASERRSGRTGFFGMLVLIAFLMAIYIFADQIAQAVPALGDVLASYVAVVDQARLWLDEKVQSLLPAAENT